MAYNAKENLESMVSKFDGALYEAAEVIRKSRGVLKTDEIDALYGVLGHLAADLSVFSEIVERLECE